MAKQRNTEAADAALVTPVAPSLSVQTALSVPPHGTQAPLVEAAPRKSASAPRSISAIFEEFLAAVRASPDADLRTLDRNRFPHAHEAMRHLAAHEQRVVEMKFVMKK